MRNILFTNGNIYVSFDPLVVADSIAVNVPFVSDINWEASVEKFDKIVDLKGRTVMPGFIDAHLHLDELGESLNSIDLRGIPSISSLVHRVESSGFKGDWILGHGWDQELFEEKRWPNLKDIEKVSGGKPLMLSRVDLHTALINSDAFRISGLSEHKELDEFVEKDRFGRPTGIIKERAFEYVVTGQSCVHVIRDEAPFL